MLLSKDVKKEPEARYKQTLLYENQSFEFFPDVLAYGRRDPESSFKVRIPYMDISLNYGEAETRVAFNIFWLVLATVFFAFWTFTAWQKMHATEALQGHATIQQILIFCINAALMIASFGSCFLFSNGRVAYTIFTAQDRNILIIKKMFGFKHSKHDEIIDEITWRRNEAYKRYAVIEPFENEAVAYKRFRWLAENGVISATEFESLTKELKNLSKQEETLTLEELPKQHH